MRDSVLSTHGRQYEEVGCLVVRSAMVAARRRTSLAPTPAGREAFAAHVAELRRIAGG